MTAQGNSSPRAARPRRVHALAATGLLVIGLLLAAHRAATLQEITRRLDRKRSELADLEQIRSGILLDETARRAWQEHYGRRPPRPLQDILPAPGSTGISYRIRAEPTVPAGPGWQCSRATVTVQATALGRIVELCRAAETAVPPWRVSRIRVTAAAGAPGETAAVLEMQTLRPDTPP